MNIVACYKIVRDEQDAQVNADGTLSFDHAVLKIGDYDLNAIEAGAQLVQAAEGSRLIALTAGGGAVDDSKIRKSVLSRGPQENVAVKDEALANASAYPTALVLAAAVRAIGDVDLVLCGEGSADLYAQQVGVQLGEQLGWPTINGASAVSVDGGMATIQRTIGNVVQTLEVALPAVVSVSSDINKPRIPSMKDILQAGKKPSRTLTLADLGISGLNDPLETVSTLVPAQKERACEVTEGADADTIAAFFAKIAERL